ncbi:sensor histidine kinase [Sphingomonas sp. PAMC26645]|uniref:sensor histidine kinase n=1 Tax=Sphingomonas sp. PAMC26645 TaxID=2565555 RepID=UPI00109DA531|nr:sensor histidine kinase [Sphingomonas sp. PAMC26645]QCB43296.1 sensor histidine kinase [Sphingomonas sp. PAMC26645]
MTLRAPDSAEQTGETVQILPRLQAPTGDDETNHRIANSLQLLSAMVSAEGHGIVDPAALAALDNTRRRIMAIARVHRLLCRTSDAAAVSLAAYLVELGTDLDETYASSLTGRRVCISTEDVFVAPDAAVSVGIIVSEIVTNACKYAYACDVAGEVRIGLSAETPVRCQVVVEDRGCGGVLNGRVDTPGLGSRLVEMMVARLGGDFVWEDASPGTRFVLRMPTRRDGSEDVVSNP